MSILKYYMIFIQKNFYEMLAKEVYDNKKIPHIRCAGAEAVEKNSVPRFKTSAP